MQHLLEEIVCKGSPEEMGENQGEWLRSREEEVFQSLLTSYFVPFWLKMGGRWALKKILTAKGVFIWFRHGQNIRKYAPHQYQRLDGMAYGSGCNEALLFGFAGIEIESAFLAFHMGCSSLAIGPARSKTKKTLLAYNHDFPHFLRPHLVVRKSLPKKEYSSVVLTYSVLSGAICGVNEKGLALSLNHAYSTQNPNDGLPPTFMVQEALDTCASTHEAVSLFLKTKFSCGSMVTVADARGNLSALELSPNHVEKRNPVNNISLTLNDYQLPLLQKTEVPQRAQFDPRKFPPPFHGIFIHATNWGRKKRMDEILKTKKFGVNDLKKILSDHGKTKRGSLKTICRHHATMETIGTAILHPVDRILEVSRGHACKARYQRFGL